MVHIKNLRKLTCCSSRCTLCTHMTVAVVATMVVMSVILLALDIDVMTTTGLHRAQDYLIYHNYRLVHATNSLPLGAPKPQAGVVVAAGRKTRSVRRPGGGPHHGGHTAPVGMPARATLCPTSAHGTN